MSIMRDMMESLDKLSVAQIQQGLQQGRYPAYLAIPAIELKTRMQKQFEQQQAMQQQPPQSTIAEQIMQEAQGVDQLPSNLPEEYAGGGIVAFDEGGEVERYQIGRLVESEEQRRAREAYEEANPFLRLLKKRQLTEEEAAAIAAGEAEQQQYYGKPDTSLTDAASAVGRGLRALIPGAGEAAIPSGMGAEMGMGGEYQAPSPTTVPSAPMAGRPDMMDANRAMAGARAPAAGPGAAPAGFAGLGAGDFKRKSAVEEFQRLMPQLQERSAARQRDLDAQIETQKVPGLAYEGMEKDLQRAEQARGVERDEAKYTAMIKAGLAMMAGTSPNAFENIGKGAMVGLEDWQRAAKDIKKAEKEHRMMMAQIEQARRAEKIGDRDKMIARLESASKHAQRMDELGVEGYMRAFGVDQDAAQDAWGKRFSASTQLAIAREKGDTSTLLALMRMGGAGEKGAMTQKQRGDAIRELEQSPETLAYVENLKKQKGKNADVSAAKAEFVKQLYNRYYGGQGGPSAVGLTPEQIELVKKYLAQ